MSSMASALIEQLSSVHVYVYVRVRVCLYLNEDHVGRRRDVKRSLFSL